MIWYFSLYNIIILDKANLIKQAGLQNKPYPDSMDEMTLQIFYCHCPR